MASTGKETKTKNSNKKTIFDLPFSVLKELCQVLDINGSWEELGGEHLKFSIPELFAFRRAVFQEFSGGSPSQAMLTRWQYKNGSIDCLYIYLSRMRHQWAMKTLYPYVSPRVKEKLSMNNDDKTGCTTLLNETYIDSSKENYKSRIQYNRSPVSSTELRFDAGDSKLAYNKQKMPTQVTATGLDSRLYSKDERSRLYFNAAQYPSQTPKMPVEGDTPYMPCPHNAVGSPGKNHWEPSTSPCRSKSQTIKDLKYEKESSWVPPAKSLSPNINIERRRPSGEEGSMGYDRMLPTTPPRKRSDPQSIAQYSSLPQISFKDIEDCTNNFNNEVLGKGGFGIVYSGNWRETPVAVKYIQKKDNPGLSRTEDTKLELSLAEIRALDSLRHRNIVSLMGYCLNGDSLCLMYQLMPNGSLEDRLQCRKNTPPLTWLQRCRIVEGAACGIQFLHTVRTDRPLIHGDIKSANILLDENLEPKLGDFGLVREGPPNELTHMYVRYVHGTRAYLPLEYLQTNKLSTKVDTYSFGVVMFEVATGLRAYDTEREKERKTLAFHVKRYDESKLFQLRDRKAGEKHSELFKTFMNIGMQCTDDSRSIRPEMVVVFRNLRTILHVAEIKERAEREPCNVLLNTPEMTPFERQIFYDHRSIQNGSRHENNVQNGHHQRSVSLTPPEETQIPHNFQSYDVNPPTYEEACEEVVRMANEGITNVSAACNDAYASDNDDSTVACMIPDLTELGIKTARKIETDSSRNDERENGSLSAVGKKLSFNNGVGS